MMKLMMLVLTLLSLIACSSVNKQACVEAQKLETLQNVKTYQECYEGDK